MRIIGGHDYYDGAVPFDTDRTRVFVRNSEESDFMPFEKWQLHTAAYIDDSWSYTVVPIELLFCGRRYRGIRLERINNRSYEVENVYHWEPKKLLEKVKFAKRPRWRRSEVDQNIYESDLERYFTSTALTDLELIKVLEHHVLIAFTEVGRYGGPRKWIINGDNLKNIHFASVFSPWQAYQELDMFLGTILVGDDDRMVKVSDATKIGKYGFDQFSFRNQVHPGKPRHK